MEEDNDPILCFQHCSNANILCLNVPELCPICSLSTTCMKIPPFRLPTPFVNSKDCTYSIVVKPTTGSFLDSAGSVLTDDLHVGISDSKGVVVDFDEDGVNKNNNGWQQCLGVNLVKKGDVDILYEWDVKLEAFSSDPKWTACNYMEESNNCFSFALEFLSLVGLHEKYPCIKERISFCEELLLPLTKEAIKYVQIYERLCTEGGVIVEKTVIDTPL